LKFGFIAWADSEVNLQKLQCIIRKCVLSNECMKPGKLMRLLRTKHSQLVGKPITFFERISMTFKEEQSSFQKCFMVDKSVVKAFIY